MRFYSTKHVFLRLSRFLVNGITTFYQYMIGDDNDLWYSLFPTHSKHFYPTNRRLGVAMYLSRSSKWKSRARFIS